MSSTLDFLTLYKVIKDLTKPFSDMEAYELGIIDDDGKLLRSPYGRDEKKAYNPYTRFIVNIKRLLQKFGLKSRTSVFAATLFMLREEYTNDEDAIDYIIRESARLSDKGITTSTQLFEEIANSTGAAVTGTGDDAATWKAKSVLKKSRIARRDKKKSKEEDQLDELFDSGGNRDDITLSKETSDFYFAIHSEEQSL